MQLLGPKTSLECMEETVLDNRALVKSIVEGNREAFREFVVRYERLVRHVVFRMLPNQTDREDVCQDVFMKIYQNLAGFQFNSQISTWVARISYNTCLNHLEKKKVPLIGDCVGEEETTDCWTDTRANTEGYAEDRDVSVKICSEIDKLPVIYGTILSLFHLQEMRYHEIATILSMPEGTVKSYLFRARKMLKERLMDRYALEELCA